MTEAKLISANELADRLNITRRTVYRMVKENQIPKSRVRGQWRFDWALIQNSLCSRIPTSSISE